MKYKHYIKEDNIISFPHWFPLPMNDSKVIQWNLSNLTHQGDQGNVSEYSGFTLVNRNTLGPYIFVGYHMMSENSGVGLHKFHCNSLWPSNSWQNYFGRFVNRPVGQDEL